MPKKTPRSKKRGLSGPDQARGGKKAHRRGVPKRALAPEGAAAGPEDALPTNVDSIRQLVELMVENDLDEIDIAHGKTKILLRRGGVVTEGGAAPAPAAAAPAAGGAPQAAAAPQAAGEEPAKQELIEITSPMVGTFFAAPSPDSDPYVTVGAGVSDDTVVCIVEAMKVMNEIKAECTGAIAEVCVKNAQPVEFGQVLFKVKPA